MSLNVKSDLTELIWDIFRSLSGTVKVFNQNQPEAEVQEGLLEKQKIFMSPDDQVFLASEDNGCWLNPFHSVTKGFENGRTLYDIASGSIPLLQVKLSIPG